MCFVCFVTSVLCYIPDQLLLGRVDSLHVGIGGCLSKHSLKCVV